MNDFGGKRVLVVEPDSWARRLLIDFFRGEGFEADGAADAHGALACAGQFDPHLLLSNYQLSAGLNGVDLALALRELKSDLALVFLSKLPEQDLSVLPTADRLIGAKYCSSDSDFDVANLLGSVKLALAAAR